ncbi:MAG: hypothetical protein KC800_04325 [Candidatus Eremiobacteraeota bacterium]|nr:hypothetical protein [Candidatus Eremiobacteraeota bacterium]
MKEGYGRLLAVDLGLKTAWSVWDGQGRLVSHDRRRFPNRTKMKSGIWSIVRDISDVEVVVAEGDPRIAKIWFACNREWETELVQAVDWRPDLLPSRMRRTGSIAKDNAVEMATRVAQTDGCGPTKLLNHDVAEAILLGYWAVTGRGWRVWKEL